MPFQNRRITLNGKQVGFIPGESVLNVANRNRIFVPTLCFDPNLSISGHCKVCFVEIDGRLKPACTTKVEQGMVIEIDSEKAREARKKRVEIRNKATNFAKPTAYLCNVGRSLVTLL